MIRFVRAGVLLAIVAAGVGAQGSGQRIPPRPPTPPRPVLSIDEQRALELEARLKALYAGQLVPAIPQPDVDLFRSRALVEAERALSGMYVDVEQAAMRAAEFALNSEVLWARQSVNCSNLPGPRFPADAADSLYQQARNLINSNDFRAAILRLGELQQRHPNSRCIAPGMYYHAFALYRLGADSDLREALTILDTHRTKFPNYVMASEVATLATRVRGQLAQRGDANARALLRTADGGALACDTEEQSVRSEALRALMRIDPDAAMPRLRAILEEQDGCVDLRRGALQILGSRRDEQSINALMTTARSDSSPALRASAVTYVAQYGTDVSAAALETIARNDQSEMVRRAAARSLVGHPAARARTAARAILEDNSVSDNVRVEMLGRYTAERSSPEDAAWMRAAFPRVSSARVKQGIIGAVGRIGRTEDHTWLMQLSTNDSEPAQLRQEAFRHVSRSMSVAQLSQAYDNAGSTVVRERVLRALATRPEQAAGDKMLEVVRRGTDPRVRSTAISLLMEKKDPRLTAALLELIDR